MADITLRELGDKVLGVIYPFPMWRDYRTNSTVTEFTYKLIHDPEFRVISCNQYEITVGSSFGQFELWYHDGKHAPLRICSERYTGRLLWKDELPSRWAVNCFKRKVRPALKKIKEEKRAAKYAPLTNILEGKE